MSKPLAATFRPQSLDDVRGQKHLLGKNSVFRMAVESGALPNMIFYGPSGVGKTTVATIVAKMSNKKLFKLNGTQSSVGDIKDIIFQIDTIGAENGILLYLDEIQYLNKKQQQSLLEVIEDGSVTLIASTTENPYFSVFNAILSRSTIFEFKPLTPEDIARGINRVIKKYNRENHSEVALDPQAEDIISHGCSGDMRKALNALELLISAASYGDIPVITGDMAKQVAQRSSNRFDNGGNKIFLLIQAHRQAPPLSRKRYLFCRTTHLRMLVFY